MPRKRPHKSQFSVRLRNLWLPIIAGLIIIFIIFLLARTLSRPARIKPETVTELKKIDLNAYTSMLGEIRIDTSLPVLFSPELCRQLLSIDTMIANRELRDAIARLNKIYHKRNTLEKALLHGYTGFCYHELAQPANALTEFKKGIALLETVPGLTSVRILRWLAFNTGYLFQYFSYPESARNYYRQSVKALAITGQFSPEFAGALFNNLGVALELLGDTLEAKNAYLQAAGYIDTTADTPQVRKLKTNIHRLGKKYQP